MSQRILSVSNDMSLLATRKLLLERRGYAVVNALGFSKALTSCHEGGFELFILGHSIPHDDKLALVEAFRAHCAAPIVSLERPGEHLVPCDYHASPDEPEKFLDIIASIMAWQELKANLGLA